MTTENRMRRAPQQARGQRRVAIILEAAAQVFAEVGYEAATTNAIAIRANTSIGSLYQFFPNKLAILNALANQHQTKLNTFLTQLSKEDGATLQAQISHMIDRVAEYYAANPAFQPMFYMSQSSKELALVANQTGELLMNYISRLLRDLLPTLEREESDLYATVIVYMMRALIPVSELDYEPRRERVIPQLKRMIFAYLAASEGFRGQVFTLEDE